MSSAKAQDKPKNITFRGNNISFVYQVDTVLVEDPVTGEITARVIREEQIDQLNGKQVYRSGLSTEPIGAAAQSDIKSFISGTLAELEREPFISYLELVIDEQGKVAFIDLQLHDRFINSTRFTEEFAGNSEAITDKVLQRLESIKFLPAQKDSKPVPFAVVISWPY